MSIDARTERGFNRGRHAIIAQADAIGQTISMRVAAHGRTLERELRRIVRQRWPELIAVAVTGVVVAYLAYLFIRYPLPPGTDTGQWLTISRYYIGEHVPVARTVSTVPPVVPLVLSGLTIVVPDRTLAIVVLAAALYVLLAGLSFLVGKQLTRDAAGGLLTVVFVCVAQGDLFDFFSMGAYPQLVAVIGMAWCLLGLLMVAENEHGRGGWCAIAAGTALTLFSHTPSATVLLPILACCLAYLAWRSDHRLRTALIASAAIVPVLIAWSAFLLQNPHSIFGYANVAAAYDLKGPDKLFNSIWSDPNERIMYGGSLIAIAVMLLSARAAGLRSARRQVLSIWMIALLGIILLSALRHTNTDYPRFGAYLVVPMGAVAAAAVHAIARNPRIVAAVALSVAVLAGQHSMLAFDKATAFYGMNTKGGDLTATADWLNTSAAAGTITGGTREIKWLEALTGRDSLLYLPRIYITRPWEVDRAIEAELLQRATAGIETGRYLASVNNGGQDSGKVFPVGLRVDLFHKGIYTNAFSLNDRNVRLELESFGKSQSVTLATSERPVTTTGSDADGAHIITRYQLTKQKAQVIRDVTANPELPRSLQIDYYVGTLGGVAPKSLIAGITRPDGSTLLAADVASSFSAHMFDGTDVPIDMTSAWERVPTAPQGGSGMLIWRKISLRLQVNGAERRINETRTYDAQSILASNGLRYIIDRDGDGAAFPVIRDFNLAPVYANDQYKVYDVATQ